MDLAEPIAAGRDADLFALGPRQVLRRYRTGGDVTVEAAVMRHVAEHNYPVPVVYEARGSDMIMDRLDGPTMFEALGSGTLDEHAAGAMLANLHDRLHALPARLALDPATRILHMDLHPGNIMLIERGPVVIDWRNTTEGDPDLDVAMSALILAEAAVTGSRLSRSAQALLATFLELVEAEPTASLDQAVVRRSSDPNLSTQELERVADAANLVRKLG